jgi:CelD/BcsL family acetyltransferase involved in cellulose biosynthesis
VSISPACSREIALSEEVPQALMLDATEVQVVDRPEAICSLWLDLEADGLCLPFQRYEWARQWCEVLAPSLRAKSCVALVTRGRAPLLLLPLCIVQRGPVRSLEFMDGGVNDYNAPVLSRLARQLDAGSTAVLLRRILHSLPQHDCVQLRRMPLVVGGVPNPLLLPSPHLRPEEEAGHRVVLSSFQEGARSLQKEAAKKRRRLERTRRVELVVDRNTSAAFDALISWKRRQFPGGALESETTVNFYRSVLHQGGVASLFGLCVDGTVVAAQYAALSGRTCIGLITGYDPAWQEFSPGKLLTSLLLEHLHKEGYLVFDAGRGAEAYKADYGGEWQPLFRYRRAVSPAGLAYLATYYAARWANSCYTAHGRPVRRKPHPGKASPQRGLRVPPGSATPPGDNQIPK